jgi:putative ABC transport system permease protein
MIGLYRLLLRLAAPDLARRHGDELAATAARLAADARAAGLVAWLRYWIAELHSLAATARQDRSPRKVSRMLPTLIQDVRYALRLLARTPGATIVALLTLTLGIGANTAIFSVVDGVLLKPLPYPDPDRLVLMQHALLTDPTQLVVTTPGNFYDIQRDVRGVQPMAGFSGGVETMTGRGDPERLNGIRSAGSVLAVSGVQPQLGRIFTEDDDRLGASKVVVISDGVWRRLFGARPDAIGETVTLGGQPQMIVGVMPRGFTFPDTDVDFWGPAQLRAELRSSRTEYFLLIVGRLQPGVTLAAARGELDSVMTRLRERYPQANGAFGLAAQPLGDALVANVSRLLWILMATVGCVLLIACANLANLLLARATGRTREIAIRQTIGASQARVIRQLLVESVVLAALGGIAGIAAGRFFLASLIAWLPAGIPRLTEASVDVRVLLFTLAATLMTGVCFGLAPAMQLARSAPAAVLRDNTRTASGRSRVRSLLVVGEIAIALVLLAGAGLLVRSFIRMARVDPGFASDRLLTFIVRMEGPAYGQSDRRLAFVRRTIERLEMLPGVTAAGAGSYAPVAGRGTGAWFNDLAHPWPAGTTPPAVPYRVVTTGYFRALQIPLVRGRLLRESDGLGATPSVVISESVARRFWPSRDPIGSEIYLGAPDNKLFDRATVVGIVKDVKIAGLGSPLTDAVYGLTTLMPFWRGFTYTVRTSGDPAALAPAVRQIVREADPLLAVTNMQSMTDIMRASVAPTRASMLLLALFAGIAMVMAAIGVFGVMSYSVNLRVREMGIRMALGARPAEVRRLVVRDGLKQSLVGIALGLAGAAWLTRTMSSMLFEVRPGDPLTLGAVAIALLSVSALACYIPARRATRVDPLVVLRAE